MFVQAILKNGEVVVSEFSKLTNLTPYAAQAFARMRPFNHWEVTGTVHPESGERVLYRTRHLISGDYIMSMTEVEPKPGREEDHNYDPDNFQPVSHMQKGAYGSWTAPAENTPEGAVAGVKYPIHRDEATWQMYVILKVATEDTPEVRYVLADPNGITTGQPYRGQAIGEGNGVSDMEGSEGDSAEW